MSSMGFESQLTTPRLLLVPCSDGHLEDWYAQKVATYETSAEEWPRARAR